MHGNALILIMTEILSFDNRETMLLLLKVGEVGREKMLLLSKVDEVESEDVSIVENR